MRFIFLLIILLVTVFGVTFTILNSESVTINYYVSQFSIPLSLLLILVFSLGCLFGWVVNAWIMIRSKWIERKMRHRIQHLEDELETMRASLQAKEVV